MPGVLLTFQGQFISYNPFHSFTHSFIQYTKSHGLCQVFYRHNLILTMFSSSNYSNSHFAKEKTEVQGGNCSRSYLDLCLREHESPGAEV